MCAENVTRPRLQLWLHFELTADVVLVFNGCDARQVHGANLTTFTNDGVSFARIWSSIKPLDKVKYGAEDKVKDQNLKKAK